MSLILWKDEFSVGVDEVDHEHRELVALINQLHDDMSEGAGRDEIVDGQCFVHRDGHRWDPMTLELRIFVEG